MSICTESCQKFEKNPLYAPISLNVMYSPHGLKEKNLGLNDANTFFHHLQFRYYQCNLDSNA